MNAAWSDAAADLIALRETQGTDVAVTFNFYFSRNTEGKERLEVEQKQSKTGGGNNPKRSPENGRAKESPLFLFLPFEGVQSTCQGWLRLSLEMQESWIWHPLPSY